MCHQLFKKFGPFSKGQPHQLDVNHCVLTISTQRSPEALQCLNPLGHSPKMKKIAEETPSGLNLLSQKMYPQLIKKHFTLNHKFRKDIQ